MNNDNNHLNQKKNQRYQELRDIAVRLSKLPEDKKSVFRQALKQKGIDPWKLPIVPVNDASDTDRKSRPLSFSQQRLWLLSQMDNSSEHYLISDALQLNGILNRKAFDSAFSNIIERHQSLRTCFVVDDNGKPWQSAQPAENFSAEHHDLSSCSTKEIDSTLKALLVELTGKPFDLAQDFMLRVQLIRLSEEEHILQVVMHHIASDGWSLPILIDEFKDFYTAYCQGTEPSLDALPIQYADYAYWQRSWLEDEELERQLQYWQRQLSDIPVTHGLPLDHPRPQQQSFNGCVYSTRLDNKLTDSLRQQCQTAGATLFMGLHAAFSVLISRYSRETDIVIGMPIANREQLEVADLIGFFINTLVLRSDLTGSPSFTELLSQSCKTLLEAYEYQQVPFEQIVERLQPERNLNHNPLFQVMLVLQNNREGDLSFPDLEVKPVEQSSEVAKYDLTLIAAEDDKGLNLAWEYNTDLFTDSTIKSLSEHFELLLNSLLKQADKNVFEVPMFSSAESQQVLIDWNATKNEYPKDHCIHQLFEYQAEQNLNATALIFEEQELSYQELNHQSNQLAHYLIQQGVKPDTLIGLCVDRSLEMIIGILGVLKAGGAYVPLDPAYPQERLEYIFEDTNLALVLTQTHLLSHLPEAKAEKLTLDAAGVMELLSTQPITNISVTQQDLYSSNLAYVIYTSGSTGKPKGVLLNHQGLCNLSVAQCKSFNISRQSQILQFASISFDAATWEWCMALTNGATLVLTREEVIKTPELLSTLVAEKQITHATLPPVLLALLEKEKWGSVGTLIVAGESCAKADAQVWSEGRQFINAYGPSETTVCATMGGFSPDQKKLHIGSPLQNIHVYVLNQYHQPVPVGAAGELYIGGDSLARGYLNRPELTAEKFVANPFSDGSFIDNNESRLYKTGDLVRWLPDGNLDFIGRIDDQVKIRGYRIELGEIESQLLTHELVEQGVILVREDISGDKRLVAYVVLTETDVGEDSVKTLREHLVSALPAYMVPSAYVVLDYLPLTVNGKINRKVLPAPEASDFGQSEYIAPATETETILAEIWAELLQLSINQISIQDNFFALGGHSLLVVQLLARLRDKNLQVDIQGVFTAPTLEQLAAYIEQQSEIPTFTIPKNLISEGCAELIPSMLPLVNLSQAEIDTIVATVPGGVSNIQDIYPLAPLQEGILFHHLLDPDNDPYRVTMGLRVDTREQLDSFVEALQQVVNRHDILRTSFITEGISSPVQVVWKEAKLVIEDCSEENFSVREKKDNSPVNLTKAPILQISVAPETEGEALRVLLSYHHLLYDQVGMAIVESEAMAYLSNKADQLPAPAAFRDFVANALHQTQIQDAHTYFESQLGDIDEPSLCFGITESEDSEHDNKIETLRTKLSSTLCEHLRTVAQTCQCSPASLFHAAWGLVVSATTGRDNVVFGTVLSGRLQGVEGVERMLGMFINTLPLRLEINRQSIEDFVKNTDQQIKALLPYEQTSLTIAQGASGIVSGQPLFNSLLNYRYLASEEDYSSSRENFGIHIDGEGEGSTNYPLSISIDDLGDGFSLTAQASAKIGAERVVRYMVQAVSQLIEALTNVPTQDVCQLSVLPVQERNNQLIEWNHPENTNPENICIHQLFESQVEKTSNAIALILNNQQLTYTELNQRANQVAHYLVEQGVTAGSLIGLYLERSLEVIVGMLGILKAGGVYVPLDPSHPGERIEYMLAAADIKLVLSQSSLQNSLPKDMQIVCLDNEYLSDQSVSNLNNHYSTSSLAYVIFTSGSTGQPKGVEVEHYSFVNHIIDMAKRYEISTDDKVLQFSNISFDAALEQLFVALITGATSCLRPETVWSAAEFKQLVLDEQLTVINLPPSYATEVLPPIFSGSIDEEPSGLRMVIIGGEAFPQRVLDVWSNSPCKKSIRLINAYGPTETCITSHILEFEHSELQKVNVIGSANGSRKSYVLNNHQKLLPIGVTGELYVGGSGLARGYLNHPELTAEKFIPDPFNNDPLNETLEARLYRTGDLVRWLPDGNLEFIGRVDDQVKIRGYRIELGEIESQLLVHDHVDQSLVLAREDMPGDKRLVAYVVLNSDIVHQNEDSVNRLRNHLATVLPNYMVPSAFVILEVLPLTVNGKVNRQALPVPEASDFGQSDYIAPTTDTEKVLVKIWSEVLQLSVDTIGIHDNFFALGGHSLLVIQLLSRLQAQDLHTDIRGIFASPTLGQLARYIDEQSDTTAFVAPENIIPDGCTDIRPDMLPLVELSEEELASIIASVPGGGANIQDIYPLAPLQEGILFHHLFDPDNDPYQVAMQLRVDTREQLSAFVGALQQVVNRHDILRTSFVTEGVTSPVQVVWRTAPLVVDYLSDEDFTAQTHKPADLSQAPILHVSVASIVESKPFRVLLRYHHLLYDQVGMAIVESEAMAYLSDAADTLPKPAPFRDFVAHARHQTDEQQASDYFQSRLGDIDEPTVCFGLTDTTSTDTIRTVLPATLSQRLRTIGHTYQYSPATLFHAAWAMVAAAASGRDDVVFGTVLSGRLQGTQGADRMLGMFINTLPLRLTLSDMSVSDFIQSTDRRVKELLSYEQVSLTTAQSVSGVAHEQALFNSLLNYRYLADAETETQEREGFGIYIDGDATGRTNYPLSISIDDLGKDFAVTVQVGQEIGAPSVIRYLQIAVDQLVTALSSSPEQMIQSLSVLSQEERECQLVEWNATESAYPSDQCLHELFELQVKKTPNATAVIFGEEQLSYQELNERSNQVAHYLLAQGVLPDTLVGLCVEPSLETMVGILGVMKSGGAYVPLDPAHPAERLAYMLSDAGIEWVLSQSSLSDILPSEIQTMYLDTDSNGLLCSYTTENPSLDLSDSLASHLAYVIYTSGSTGRPKGVALIHSGLMNYVYYANQQYFKNVEKGIVSTSLSFDATITTMFSGLISGSAAHFVTINNNLIPTLADLLIHSQKPHVYKLTPSHISALCQYFVDHPASTQAHIFVVGGEQLLLSSAKEFLMRVCPAGEIINEYGPTEAVVGCSVYRLSLSKISEDDDISRAVPIGLPIANASLYILGNEGELLPRGAFGELYIGGAGLARDYLNRPELTAEKFITNPFSEDPGSRLYKTGDLVRWLPDGNLEFIGRIDEQVKVRGYRIELGEIESQLLAYESVEQAVILVREDVPGDKRLVAYAVLNENIAASDNNITVLREYLSSVLPSYMVPDAYVLLDALPLTVNGKLDRKALPVPGVSDFGQKNYMAPETKTEKILVNIWSSLLELPKDDVGVHDNFFALGGHSLLVMQAVLNIRKEFLVDITLKDFYEQTDILMLACFIDSKSLSESQLFPLDVVPDRNSIRVSHAQESLWLNVGKEKLEQAFQMPYVFILNGRVELTVLINSLKELVTRHEAFRTNFVERDGQLFLSITNSDDLNFRFFDVSDKFDVDIDDESRKKLIDFYLKGEFTSPFDLFSGYLYRIFLLKISDDQSVMLFNMAHILSDHWSMNIIKRDLAEFYSDLLDKGFISRDKDPSLIQYTDYAYWQRKWSKEESYKTQLNYWQALIDSNGIGFEFPIDFPKGIETVGYASKNKEVPISKDLEQKITDYCKSNKITFYTFFMAVLHLCLYKYSGKDHVLVASPLAERDRPEVESCVGLFLDMMLVVSNVDKSMSVDKFVDHLKQRVEMAKKNSDVHVNEIIQQAGFNVADVSLPIVFNYLEFHNEQHWSLKGIEVENYVVNLDFDTGLANTQLGLTVANQDDRLACFISYDDSLYKEETIEGMVKDYSLLLNGLASGDIDTLLVESFTKGGKGIDVLIEECLEDAY